MAEIAPILVDLFIIFAAAKIAAELFERLGQPAVVGELLVGVLIGPFALGLIGTPSQALVNAFHSEEAAREALRVVYHVIAELGVIMLLFFVGLETRVSDLLRVGPRAALVGVLGIALPFGLGLWFMSLQPTAALTDAFTATALVATSVGITARVLRDLGALATAESRTILGAAVLDDILGLLLLGVVAALAANGAEGEGAVAARGVAPWNIVALLVQAVGFVLFVALVGRRVIGRFSTRLEQLRIEQAPFTVALLVTLGFAALAGYIGLAAIIGAFLAGMVFAEAREQFSLEQQALPIYNFLVPFFFVVIGAEVNPRLFLDPALLGLAAAVTLLAVAGKLIGCGAAAWGLHGKGQPRPWHAAAVVGIGMVPRGEVGLIVAGLGRAQGIIPDRIFSVIVIMSIVTTLLAPPLLKVLFRGDPRLIPPGSRPPEEAETEAEAETPVAAPSGAVPVQAREHALRR